MAAFLKRINAEAYRSLQEAGDEPLALRQLNFRTRCIGVC